MICKQEYRVDLTPEIKQKIIGGNIARLYGIDIERKAQDDRERRVRAAPQGVPGLAASHRDRRGRDGVAMSIDTEAVRVAAGSTPDPEVRCSIAELGLLDEIKVEGGRVTVHYHLTSPLCPAQFATKIGKEIRRRVMAVPGVEACEVVIQDHFLRDGDPAADQPRRQAGAASARPISTLEVDP